MVNMTSVTFSTFNDLILLYGKAAISDFEEDVAKPDQHCNENRQNGSESPQGRYDITGGNYLSTTLDR